LGEVHGVPRGAPVVVPVEVAVVGEHLSDIKRRAPRGGAATQPGGKLPEADTGRCRLCRV
jgi:hypothetical protein